MTDGNRYQIRVQGWVGKRWAHWFEGMSMSHIEIEGHAPSTLLTGPVADQAALRSLLAKIWDLNLTVMSVIRLDTSDGHRREKSSEQSSQVL